MADEKNPSTGDRIKKFLSDVTLFWRLGQMAGALGISTYVTSILPGGWHQPQYWLAAAFAFIGSWFVLAVMTLLAQAAGRKLRPSLIRFEPHGGPGAASLAVYVERGNETLRCIGQLVTDDGAEAMFPPYDLIPRNIAEATFLKRAWRTGDYFVLTLARLEVDSAGNSALCEFCGSNLKWRLERKLIDGHRRFDDTRPVRLRVTVRGDRVKKSCDYWVVLTGEHRLFQIEQATSSTPPTSPSASASSSA